VVNAIAFPFVVDVLAFVVVSVGPIVLAFAVTLVVFPFALISAFLIFDDAKTEAIG
jgi:hypothetical protein